MMYCKMLTLWVIKEYTIDHLPACVDNDTG